MNEKYVTVYDFVNMLLAKYEGDDIFGFDDGYKAGWLEEIDILNKSRLIDKKNASRIIHMFIKKILGETDEVRWNNAKKLADLYDCRTCVNHVAQVYEKGIFEAEKLEDNRIIFGMQHSITVSELDIITARVYDKSIRIVYNNEDVINSVSLLEHKVAMDMINESVSCRSNILVIDVRSENEYGHWHIDNSINISVTEILSGNLILPNNIDKVFVYCEKGYQSEIAANYIYEQSSKDVFYFGLN